MQKLLNWCKENILYVITLFLLAFIPLYPKIPLLDIKQTWVSIRFEDILLVVTAMVLLVTYIRERGISKSPLCRPILIYWIVGGISLVNALLFIFPHFSGVFFPYLAILHFMRRIEYMLLFFVAYEALKKNKNIIPLLWTLGISYILIILYGFGQKFLGFPAFLTMNEEFAKGIPLRLPPTARFPSTFGGHYDFAAFLVMGLMISIIGMFYVRRRWVKMVSVATFFLSLWSLMMTSSRSSFLAYLLAITMFALWMMKKSIKTGMLKFVGLYFFTFSFLFLFGDLSERFAQIFQGNEAYQAMVSTVDKVKENSFKPLVEPPKDGISIDDVNKAAEEAAKRTTVPVIVSSDTQPTPVKPADLPPDVFEDIPDAIISTKSAEGKDIEIIIPRVFSENAHRLGLSAAIRLDTLWPFAIRGFLRNPLFGSGYSTLTKYTIEQFTEAESTDNDFLRTLGDLTILESHCPVIDTPNSRSFSQLFFHSGER